MTTLRELGYDDVDYQSYDGIETLGKVVDVYDGDTITVIIEKPKVVKIKIRMYGINASEMKGGDRENGIKARDYLLSEILEEAVEPSMPRASIRKILKDSRKLVRLELGKYDKYGRVLAKVFSERGTDLSMAMVSGGYAREYIL